MEWGSLAKKTHLVNWKTVCSEKKKGGLGLRRFSILNKALMCKWCWRFANERDSLWRKVIRSKFGEVYGGWSSGEIKGGFGVGLWKEIRKEWTHLLQNTSLVLGNGNRISFWKDAWCGEEALSLMFPNLFRLTAQKMPGRRICGIGKVGREVGIRFFYALSTIGKWRR